MSEDITKVLKKSHEKISGTYFLIDYCKVIYNYQNIYSSVAELRLSSYYEYCRDNYVYFKNKAII